jgi:inhibitor of cysteine peptidase
MRKVLAMAMFFVLSIAAVLLSAGCDLKTAKYTETDSGKTIEASVSQQFTITLRGNETTGYVWQMAKGTNSKIVKKISDKYTADNTGLVGSGGDHVWTFKAVAAGETTITLNYFRPWEKPVVPTKTLKYKIKVQ